MHCSYMLDALQEHLGKLVFDKITFWVSSPNHNVDCGIGVHITDGDQTEAVDQLLRFFAGQPAAFYVVFIIWQKILIYTAVMITVPEAEMVEIRAEFALFHPYTPVYISAEGKVSFLEPTYYFMHDSMAAGELAKWHVKRCEDSLVLTLYKADFDLSDDRPFRMSVQTGNYSWKKSEVNYERLIWGRICPESMVFILTH